MKKRQREPKPLHPLLTTATGPSLIKYLASCNTTIRSQSLRQLQTWLRSQPQHLSHSDIKKLWKGLFYSLWHSDKSPNQLALIDRLTSLFLSLDPALSLDFFRGFLITLRREWPGIDRLRLDKFYLLIRKFVKALFELMKDRKWDKEVLEGYFGVLENDALVAEDELKGNGVCYHLVSVFVEELKGVGFPVNKEVVEGLFGPFFKVLGKSKDKVLVGKVKGCVFGELVEAGKALLEKRKLGEDCDDLLGVVALTMGLSGKFYEVGSSEECVQGNRKFVIGLHEEFLKLERELEVSKVEIVVPEYSYEVDEEVPQLVPIDDGSNGSVELNLPEGIEGEGQGDDGNRTKRSKRAKKEGDGEDKKVKKKKSKKAKKEVDGDDKEAKKKSKKAKKEVDGDDKEAKKKSKKAKKEVDGDDKEAKKKSKKAKKEVDGDDEEAKKKTKKKKKKKDKDENVVTEMESAENGNGSILTDVSMENLESLGNDVELNENVISNLQKQFEKVAAEGGGDEEMDDDSDISGTPFLVKNNTRSNKKKRGKRGDSNGAGDSGVEMTAKSGEKSGKKVTFSMKNNIFWKPTTPLPPESLRLPPTVVPRGSALKKGVPPGPVVEMATPKKRVNQRKKALKRMRSATPMKRSNKVVTGSA